MVFYSPGRTTSYPEVPPSNGIRYHYLGGGNEVGNVGCVFEDKNGNTHWYVLHAEANAILKTASSNHNCSGATLYLTMSPCKECSKLIHQSGIKRLVYINKYKDMAGINFLKEAGVKIEQIEI